MKQNLFVRLAICLLMCQAASAFAQMPQPFSADMSTTSANGNLNMSGKMYISMPRMRIDMTNVGQQKSPGPMGGNVSMIVDGPAKTMYMLMTEQHMYMEFPMDQNSPMTQRMPKFSDMLKGSDPCAGREGATCKKVGTESISGRSCDKWEVTEKSGKTETIWMDQKLHFPHQSYLRQHHHPLYQYQGRPAGLIPVQNSRRLPQDGHGLHATAASLTCKMA